MRGQDRWVSVSDLVTGTEIAERYGVTPAAVANWTARYDDFPQPVKEVPRLRLWLWTEVERWLRQYE